MALFQADEFRKSRPAIAVRRLFPSVGLKLALKRNLGTLHHPQPANALDRRDVNLKHRRNVKANQSAAIFTSPVCRQCNASPLAPGQIARSESVSAALYQTGALQDVFFS